MLCFTEGLFVLHTKDLIKQAMAQAAVECLKATVKVVSGEGRRQK